ncbi:NEL-type E3 ubiquitin ligase domain-containing protein [Serratia symbiotica]|nr:NEL-type E3 ubiquitin ligase domain-containing protein [Serratia symbiotica]
MEIFVEGNPLSERSIRGLIDIDQLADYTGPQIFFSLSEDGSGVAPRPLTESVRDWLSAQSSDSTWAAIEKEENAATFSAFLSRLGETQNAQENPAFKARVSDWLTRLAETPALRETTFTVAQEATTSCEDRVTLAWNDMQKVALVYDVENGAWDDRLPELMIVGCEMFRLEQLEQVARDKVNTLRFVDEVEVYLAYQTGLRDALRLTSAGERMRYGDVSGVTQEDLDRALVQVREREKRAFPTWLAQWTPWKTALYRASPGFVHNMQEQQTRVLNDRYQHRVDAELKAAGVEGIADAEATVGKKVWDEMTGENDTALTRAFLQNRYRALMADKRPEQALKAVTELTSVAASAPAVAAMAVRPGNVNEAHPGSLLAARVAEGGMAPLAEAWVSLLHLLYENKYLDKEGVISALLPHKKQDRVGSLAHAIAGAAWNSEAATKLCALLSDVAGSDENSRQDIMARLSLKLPGDRFSQLNPDQAADFYERAKKADKLSRNEAAKAHLKEGGLIPESRELYRMVSRAQTGVWRTKNPKSSFEALQEEIKEKITPQVLVLLHTAMAREKAELDRAKITTREQLDGQGKEAKKRTQQAPPHIQNRQEETVDWEMAQAAKRQRNQEEVAG